MDMESSASDDLSGIPPEPRPESELPEDGDEGADQGMKTIIINVKSIDCVLQR